MLVVAAVAVLATARFELILAREGLVHGRVLRSAEVFRAMSVDALICVLAFDAGLPSITELGATIQSNGVRTVVMSARRLTKEKRSLQ